MNSLNIVHLGMKVLTPPLVVIQTRIETKQSSSLLDKFFWGVKTFIPKCTFNILRFQIRCPFQLLASHPLLTLSREDTYLLVMS